MDRNTLLRIVLIAGAILVIWKFVLPKVTGSGDAPPQHIEERYTDAPTFVPDEIDPPKEGSTAANAPAEGELCKVVGKRFDATLSTRGAAITHFNLRDDKYRGVDGFDMSTTPDQERWRSLRTLFRGLDAKDQVKYDRFDWKLEKLADDKGCKFTYEDELVKIVKTITASERPFELNVETTLTNLSDAPKRHEFSIEAFSYRTSKEMKGSLGRQSPFQTGVECAAAGDVTRKAKGDFKAGWLTVAGTDRYAAVNSHFFTQALVPEPGDGAVSDAPTCGILAQDWAVAGMAPDDDNAPTIFHAKLSYAPRAIDAHQSVTYKNIAFFGPKEREVLATAAGGKPKLQEVINLGFFTPVAKYLVMVLVFIHDHITGNWGLAIIAMTIALRTLLFPLTFKSIKTTINMRRLKPEVDKLNEKFKDDAQAKNLAMMELWKKHGVNPFGGCLPQVVQMPVWFAMYTTLQTAVDAMCHGDQE